MEKTSKITLRDAFKEAVKSRVFMTLTIIVLVQLVVFLILLFTMGKIGSVQVPVRYDGFSYTELFRDNGSYLLNFAFFGVVVFIANILVALKMYSKKGRLATLAILWLTIAIFLIATILLISLLGVGSVL